MPRCRLPIFAFQPTCTLVRCSTSTRRKPCPPPLRARCQRRTLVYTHVRAAFCRLSADARRTTKDNAAAGHAELPSSHAAARGSASWYVEMWPNGPAQSPTLCRRIPRPPLPPLALPIHSRHHPCCLCICFDVRPKRCTSMHKHAHRHCPPAHHAGCCTKRNQLFRTQICLSSLPSPHFLPQHSQPASENLKRPPAPRWSRFPAEPLQNILTPSLLHRFTSPSLLPVACLLAHLWYLPHPPAQPGPGLAHATRTTNTSRGVSFEQINQCSITNTGLL